MNDSDIFVIQYSPLGISNGTPTANISPLGISSSAPTNGIGVADTNVANDPTVPQNFKDGVFSGIITVGNSLIAGKDTNTGGVSAAQSSSDIVFWAGAAQPDRASAPFRVDAAGNVTANSITISGYVLSTTNIFGGSGSDGALSVTSGTTTIDLGNAAIVVKNYTSINIASGATLTFSNPKSSGSYIVLKSQGGVTIAGTISAVGMGATGGPGGIYNGSGGVTGTDGTNNDLTYAFDSANHYGLAGVGGGGSGGAGGGVTSALTLTATNDFLTTNRLSITPGAGGGGGGSSDPGGGGGSTGATGNGGAGGRGGGALIIECGGAWNFTGTITAAGQDGSIGSNGPINRANGAGGGGGGGGGMIYARFQSLTANSGVSTITGGAGGSGGSAGPGHLAGDGGGAGGGGAASAVTAGTSGTTGQTGAAGGAGGAGGTGGNGLSIIKQITSIS